MTVNSVPISSNCPSLRLETISLETSSEGRPDGVNPLIAAVDSRSNQRIDPVQISAAVHSKMLLLAKNRHRTDEAGFREGPGGDTVTAPSRRLWISGRGLERGWERRRDGGVTGPFRNSVHATALAATDSPAASHPSTSRATADPFTGRPMR